MASDVQHRPSSAKNAATDEAADLNITSSSSPELKPLAPTMTISPELFEKLYLTPKVPKQGFANPTPMGFVGFVISTFTFAMVIMGWGGAGGLAGVAGIFFVCRPWAQSPSLWLT